MLVGFLGIVVQGHLETQGWKTLFHVVCSRCCQILYHDKTVNFGSVVFRGAVGAQKWLWGAECYFQTTTAVHFYIKVQSMCTVNQIYLLDAYPVGHLLLPLYLLQGRQTRGKLAILHSSIFEIIYSISNQQDALFLFNNHSTTGKVIYSLVLK